MWMLSAINVKKPAIRLSSQPALEEVREAEDEFSFRNEDI